MKINTTRFGELEIADEKIINFPHGILGFENNKKFFLLDHDKDNDVLCWLQSVEIPDLAFVVANPARFFNDYIYNLKDDYLKILSTDNAKDLVTFIILSFYDKGNLITANLMAPLIVNIEKFVGTQAILDEPHFTTKHQLYPAEEKVAAK